ncbi:MAG: FAD/NAD(P)-binding protein [bacterium]
MFNPYQTKTAKIVKITDLAFGIKLFEFDAKPAHEPGQFMMLSLPGFGEAPFAPCNRIGKNLELCVRAVGRLTNKLHSLKTGDRVGVRGSYGNGWPVAGAQIKNEKLKVKSLAEKKNLLIVVGGLGLVPLRSLIMDKEKFLGREALVQIFYGARTPDDFLFRDEFESWRKKGIDIQLTIDKECPEWSDCVGMVPVLFDKRNVVKEARAFLCGPPVMYKSVLQKVKEHKFRDEDIFLSFERRMHCGVGVCQHCAIGPFYTCKQGPVFSYDKIKNIQGAI